MPEIIIDRCRGCEGPLQCLRCQAFRHSSANCHRSQRCVCCGKGHIAVDCPRPRTPAREYNSSPSTVISSPLCQTPTATSRPDRESGRSDATTALMTTAATMIVPGPREAHPLGKAKEKAKKSAIPTPVPPRRIRRSTDGYVHLSRPRTSDGSPGDMTRDITHSKSRDPRRRRRR
ncbi:hypothetical protein EVAR_91200_1 [Eumeta japonica]|uniref:CCHC-type domain-containing protein n=1 Tax=Eumeta variegata TaxID=151549 RepID=A0A4C1ZKE4_EUMVA|nr:hypothetical protein EVAR_91200_1 [Eumeta japonica]